jgi:hypothetical protein
MSIKISRKILITAYFTSNVARVKGEIVWRKLQ